MVMTRGRGCGLIGDWVRARWRGTRRRRMGRQWSTMSSYPSWFLTGSNRLPLYTGLLNGLIGYHGHWPLNAVGNWMGDSFGAHSMGLGHSNIEWCEWEGPITRGWILIRRMVEYFTRRLKSGSGWSGEGMMDRGGEGAISLPLGGTRGSGDSVMDRGGEGGAISLPLVGTIGSGEGVMDRGGEGAISLPLGGTIGSGEGVMDRGGGGGAISLPLGGTRGSGEGVMDRGGGGGAISLPLGGTRGSGDCMMDRGEGGAVSLP